MTKNILFMTAAAAFSISSAIAASTIPAEASRCPQGYVYRPSKNICQHRTKYVRQSRERRYSSIAKHRAKRDPAASRAIRSPAAIVAAPNPIWYSVGQNSINRPYGHLDVLLQKYDPRRSSWASMKILNVSAGWAEAAHCLRSEY
jgi:hypothetical protein